jgi:hypothetical protein
MKKESKTYTIIGPASLNTTVVSQAEILSDIRSITGVTTVGFTPNELGDRNASYNNPNYKGEFKIKIDNFPFTKFDRSETLKNIVNTVRKIPAVNYFRASLESLME